VSKHRLDEELVARGLFASRSRARDAVLRRTVFVNGAASAKPSQTISETDVIEVHDAAQRYVSRAALKLVHALDEFEISVADRICMDIGASTGGFTQVLLERGAAHVTAIDVGHRQIAEVIASDPRVTVIEGLNARDISSVPGGLSFIVCDVSFISLKLALPAVLQLAPKNCELVALIKPQFEVGREKLGKGGIVRDDALRAEVEAGIMEFFGQSGWVVKAMTQSPIEGGDGNKESLAFAIKSIAGK
jgi:23S rRNA (cytidine1920-2'-O)/16S rRNA (cytidine1409-2'-O)-methyltransferase